MRPFVCKLTSLFSLLINRLFSICIWTISDLLEADVRGAFKKFCNSVWSTHGIVWLCILLAQGTQYLVLEGFPEHDCHVIGINNRSQNSSTPPTPEPATVRRLHLWCCTSVFTVSSFDRFRVAESSVKHCRSHHFVLCVTYHCYFVITTK